MTLVLYDMAGNVWEIVADRYHPEAYALRADHIVNNPQGPDGSFWRACDKGAHLCDSRGLFFMFRCLVQWLSAGLAAAA